MRPRDFDTMNENGFRVEALTGSPSASWKGFRERLDGYMDGYRLLNAVRAGVSLGIFDSLVEPSTVEDLSGRLGTDTEMTRMLCNVLVEEGLLIRDGDVYSDSDEAKAFLVSQAPHFHGPILDSSDERLEPWGRIADMVRNGPDYLPYEEFFSRKWIEGIARSAMLGPVASVLDELEGTVPVKDGDVILDVGGGHGLYVIGLCLRHPGAKGRVFDRDRILEAASENSKAAGVRLDLVPGDYYENDLPGGNDLLLIFSNPAGSDPEVTEKLARSLNPGGRIVIRRRSGGFEDSAVRNMDWNLKLWEGFKLGEKRFGGISAGKDDEYIRRLAELGVSLVSRNQTDPAMEMLVFRKDANRSVFRRRSERSMRPADRSGPSWDRTYPPATADERIPPVLPLGHIGLKGDLQENW